MRWNRGPTRLAVAATLLIARTASAGICEAPRVEWLVQDEEQRARQAKPGEGNGETDNVCFDNGDHSPWIEVAAAEPQLGPRLIAACSKIMDKRPDDRDCAIEVAYLGKDAAGSHDIVAAIVASRPNKISDRKAPEALGMTRASRAEPILLARWKELQPLADKQPGNADLQGDWASWRTNAAIALGTVGGADAKAFLTDQLAQKIDRGVKKRAAEAIATIDRRATAAIKSPTETK
ncbi:MAG TPA: hypothetical protein VH165_30155 [Kofleriaceae bacterium]|nr:hypothetical protein [Kofleriaceae bacterium]